MAYNSEKIIQKGNEFLNEIATALGNPDDQDHAYRVLSAVFNALRNRITVEESVHLIAQLPMLIKAFYVDGWKISSNQRSSSTLEGFLECVKDQNPRTAGRDFGNNEDTRKAVEAVIKVLKNYVTEGEINHIKAQLPEEIAEILEA
jgi:uncharacterized protein (DUF2267 family)